jgi:amino acid transporter
MIILLACEGFELIANSAQDVRAPVKILPQAFYSALSLVVVLYILIAVVTVGTLRVAKIGDAKDYALTGTARPLLGQTRFLLNQPGSSNRNHG